MNLALHANHATFVQKTNSSSVSKREQHRSNKARMIETLGSEITEYMLNQGITRIQKEIEDLEQFTSIQDNIPVRQHYLDLAEEYQEMILLSVNLSAAIVAKINDAANGHSHNWLESCCRRSKKVEQVLTKEGAETR